MMSHERFKRLAVRREDACGDLGQRRQEEVHRRIGGLVVEGRAAVDGDALVGPAHRGELRSRLETALGDEGEADPLHQVAIDAPSIGGRAQRVGDPETLPDAVENVDAAQPARVDDVDVAAGDFHIRPGRVEDPADRAHQARQCLRSTLSARPKLWMTLATGLPVTGWRSLWANWR
jgi:hypothetical protein